MTHACNILLVSRKKDVLDALERTLGQVEGVQLRRQFVVNGHVDPLHGVDALPDVMILHLSHTWRDELESLAARTADRRPALIVLGSAGDANVMRLAMQAGARDLLPVPLAEADLLEAVARIRRDRQPAADVEATITAFMNAKGGSGATFLACNVAHVLAAKSHQRVALLDLDLQFGTTPLYLDLFPKRGILQALENLAELDEVAFAGYMAKHASGLEVLGHAESDPTPLRDLPASQVEHLLDLAGRGHDHVVVDLPRHIDAAASAVLQRALHVVVVVQQSITTLRDATRLLRFLRVDMGLSKERICVVVNRYEKDAPVGLDDVRKTLGCDDPAIVPNDFATVSDCVNGGTPLLSYARTAAVTRAVMALETRLGGQSARTRPGLLARTFSGLLNARSS